MATDIKALMAARLAAAKEKNANTNNAGQATVQVRVPEPSVDSAVPATVPEVGQSTAAAGSTVVIGAELQSQSLVVLEQTDQRPALAGDSGGGEGLVRESEPGGTDLDVSNPIHLNFLQRLGELEAALLTRDPLMKTHLAVIHKTMIEYEEIPVLLRPEEIAKIMSAQQVHTDTFLAAKATKTASKKKLPQLSLDDI